MRSSSKIMVAGVGIIALLMAMLSAQAAFSQAKKETPPPSSKEDLYNKIELFSYALTTIRNEYLYEKTPKDLIYGSLKGMLSSLDPHSQFMDLDDFKELKTETEGKFGGIGIEITVRDGLLTVITPLDDTPASKAGMKAGDRIVKIDKDLTRDMTLSDAVKKLRGQPGTKVHVTILREKEGLIKDLEMNREIIHVVDVKDPRILSDNIGYLRLSEFREDSHKEFRKALDGLKDQGADSLIVDLRNNPGGLLSIGVKVSEEFLAAGKVIVSTKNRRPSQDVVFRSSNRNGPYLDWPLVVLINEGSASASEIFAGAMQDNKRGVIVGTKSFGKGSVQTVIPMPDGSALRLTTAKYMTPSGAIIHGTGINPDVTVERIPPQEEKDAEKNSKTKDKKRELDEIFDDLKRRDEETKEDPSAKKAAELAQKDQNDNQLQAALSVIKGIKVYRRFQAQ